MRNAFCCFIYLCLVFKLPTAQAQHTDFATVADGNGTPFELRSGFLVVVEGRIGPLEKLRFILDTGTTTTVISQNMADKLQLKRRSGHVLNFGKNVHIETGELPQIEFGEIRVTNLRVLIGDLGQYSEFATDVDAIIGLDLLHLKNLIFDFEAKRVSFSPERLLSPTVAEAGPLCFLVALMVQDHPVHLIIDTGLRDSTLFEDRLRARVPELRVEKVTNEVRIGKYLQGKQATLPAVLIGTKQADLSVFLLKAPPEYVLPGIDGYLAAASLKARRIHFNFDTRTLRWE